MSIGENIKRMRIEKNMTQQELGQKLGGISQQQIGRWESNKANPKKETIEKIAKALDVDPYSLYSFDMASEELAKLINQKEENEDKLLDNYRKLNNSGQDKAIEQVELLTKIPEYQKKDENTHILVNAAHARTDIEVTEEMKKHDDDIMNDENF